MDSEPSDDTGPAPSTGAARQPELLVRQRFHGPPHSGNGGYTAGLLAARLAPQTGAQTPVTVTLRLPPPLDRPMTVSLDGDARSARLLAGDSLVATAAAAAEDLVVVEEVTLADAREAETRYAGLAEHPFPTCFVCGPQRGPGDGLRLFAGPIEHDLSACSWTPDESLAGADGTVGPEFCWAALDCPGGWTADIAGRPMVLGRMTAQVDAPVAVGEPHVVTGRLLGSEGRKTFTATTVYDADGRIVGRAEHIWIAVDAETFGEIAS